MAETKESTRLRAILDEYYLEMFELQASKNVEEDQYNCTTDYVIVLMDIIIEYLDRMVER